MKKTKYGLNNGKFPCRYFSYLQDLCLLIHTKYYSVRSTPYIPLQTYFCTHIG